MTRREFITMNHAPIITSSVRMNRVTRNVWPAASGFPLLKCSLPRGWLSASAGKLPAKHHCSGIERTHGKRANTQLRWHLID